MPRLLVLVTAPSRHTMTCCGCCGCLHSTCPCIIGPVKDTHGAKYFCLPELLLFSGSGNEPLGQALTSVLIMNNILTTFPENIYFVRHSMTYRRHFAMMKVTHLWENGSQYMLMRLRSAIVPSIVRVSRLTVVTRA